MVPARSLFECECPRSMRHSRYFWWSSMGARAWLCIWDVLGRGVWAMCVGAKKLGSGLEWREREEEEERELFTPSPLRLQPLTNAPLLLWKETKCLSRPHTHTHTPLPCPGRAKTTPLETKRAHGRREQPTALLPPPSRQNRALRRPRRARLPAPTGVLQRSGVPATGRAEREAARAARAPAFCRHQRGEGERERERGRPLPPPPPPLLLPAAATPPETWCRRAAPPR